MPSAMLMGAINADGVAVDVTIEGEKIQTVRPHESVRHDGSGVDVIDLTGYVLLPAAIEPHAHLDKAFLAETIENPTGDLMGAIKAMESNRHLLGIAETIERAERAARLMARNGYSAIRTHADTTIENGLDSVLALLDVKRRVADVIDVEIVALCGWPIIDGPDVANQRALLRDALDAGADLVGGCPHLEHGPEQGTVDAATDWFLETATAHGKPVDLHTDETTDPRVLGLEHLARRVAEGFDHRVTASHCVSLGQQSVARQRDVAELVATAGISVIVLPQTNLFLQGHGLNPMPRALTSIGPLRTAGVVVAAGADNLQDPFNPVGRACPFETAALMITAAHDLPGAAWRAVSDDARTALGIAPVGLVTGSQADLLAIRATSLREAIAFASPDRMVWRRGHLTHGLV